MPKSRDELKRAMPALRSRFESSRALIQRAHETAARVVEAADAMRALLRSGDETHVRTSAEKDVWEAAAREILHGARERDRILGLLSHELRQALTAAMAAERLLHLTEDAEAGARAHGVLQRQLLYLSRLVEDLLDFSRVSLDSQALSRRDVDLDDLISQTAESVQSVIAERTQHLTVTKASAVSPVVSGDPTRLQQVFSNLLHNASRYTPPGGHINIASSVESGWARVEVRDDGHGIDPSQLAEIFEPFTRRSAEGPGLGIGLSLARRLVQLHDGTITARTNGADRGSTFTVRLPLTRVVEQTDVEQTDNEVGRSSRGCER